MIHVQKIECNMFGENCYIVSDDTRECVIIDCGAFYDEERKELVDYIEREHLTPKRLIVTHGHLDHNFGNNTVFDHYGLKPEVSRADKELMENLPQQYMSFLRREMKIPVIPVGRYFEDGEKITFGTHSFSIIPTPGHSKGSVMFYCEEEGLAFSGDTIFNGGIGRTDLPGGDYNEIISSIKYALHNLPGDTVILPGHGPQTTVSNELQYNPYVGL